MHRLVAFLVALVGLAAISACAPAKTTPDSSVNYGADTDYISIPGSPLGPALQTFTDTEGEPWSFVDVPKGRIALVYFGYTSCPDVCPLTMADIAASLRQLDANVSDKIDVVLVTTDPNRDTAKQLKGWLAAISESFKGVRGPIDDVVDAALAYGINVEAPVTSDGAYEVSHGAQLIVLGPGGGMVGYFRDLVGLDVYVSQLPNIVEQHSKNGI